MALNWIVYNDTPENHTKTDKHVRTHARTHAHTHMHKAEQFIFYYCLI